MDRKHWEEKSGRGDFTNWWIARWKMLDTNSQTEQGRKDKNWLSVEKKQNQDQNWTARMDGKSFLP